MADRDKAGITVAPVSTYRPNLFSLVAVERFARWRDLGCLAREWKRYPERRLPCWARGCSPKNTQHSRAAELMGTRGEGQKFPTGQQQILSVEQRCWPLPTMCFQAFGPCNPASGAIIRSLPCASAAVCFSSGRMGSCVQI